MSRLSGEVAAGAVTDREREANARGYRRKMGSHLDAQLAVARSEIVRKFRTSPGSFPDGVDTRWDRWYRASDWTDEGVYVGEGPCVKAVNPERELDDRLEESVTKTPPAALPTTVTKTLPVASQDDAVTKTRGGRPKKDATLSAADRAKAYRDRKKEKPE